MAARSPEIPGARFSEKRPNFLKFIEPLPPLWVLQPSQNMHMVFRESQLTRAVFKRSIEVLDGSQVPQKPGRMIFRKKNLLLFRNSSDQRHLHGFCSPLKSCTWSFQDLYSPDQCLQSQLRCLDGSQGPQKSGSTIFQKKILIF